MYGLNGGLLGVPFDVRARRVTGPAVPLVEGVMDADVRTGAMHYTLSNDGTLVYLSGGSGERATLGWVNRRNGRIDPLPAAALPYSSPRLSPDGTRVAVEVAGPDGVDIHIFDLTRNALTRLTSSTSHGRYPLWTPDSQRVVFHSDSDGGGLYSMEADGAGAVTRLTRTPAVQTPYAWADDGRALIIEQRSTDRIGAADIYQLSLAGEPTARPLVQTAATEEKPAVSPNGRWLAYVAREAGGRAEVFVRPFPQVDDRRWPISTDGGDSPLWSRDGRLLFFMSRGRAMSVSHRGRTDLSSRESDRDVRPSSVLWFDSGSRGRQWDIAPDGERFLILIPGEVATGEDSQARMVVVLNWHEELKRLVPTK